MPVVVYREDGVEPCRSPRGALGLMLALYAATREPALVAPGQALRAWVEGGGGAKELLTALACAREAAPRIAPWLLPVEGAVRVMSRSEAPAAAG